MRDPPMQTDNKQNQQQNTSTDATSLTGKSITSDNYSDSINANIGEINVTDNGNFQIQIKHKIVGTCKYFWFIGPVPLVEKNLNDVGGIMRFVFTVPRTLGLGLVPIEVAYVALPIQLALHVLAIFAMISVQKATAAGNVTIANVLLPVLRVYSFLCFLLLFPLVFFNSTSFWSCNYVTNELSAPTLSGKAARCWAASSLTDMSGVMAIVSLLVIVLQNIFAAFWCMVSADINPVGPKWSFFSTHTVSGSISWLFVQSALILFLEALPNSYSQDPILAVLLVRIIIYGVVNVFSVLAMWRNLPFYSQGTNSFSVGIIVSRLTVWLANNISTFVLHRMASSFRSENERVLAENLVVVGEAVLAVLGLLVGFVVAYLVQSIRMRRVIKLLEEHLERDQDQEFKDDILAGVSHLEISYVALLLLAKSKNPQLRYGRLLQLLFVAADDKLTKNPIDSPLVMCHALAELYIFGNSLFGFTLTVQALRTAGWTSKFDVYYNGCCLALLPEVRDHVLASELKKMALSYSLAIQIASKKFFGNLIELSSNKCQQRSTMHNMHTLADQLQVLRYEADLRWKFLFRHFETDSTLLRSRAAFLINVENKQEEAEILLQQAEQNDSLTMKVRVSRNNKLPAAIGLRMSRAGRRVSLPSTPELIASKQQGLLADLDTDKDVETDAYRTDNSAGNDDFEQLEDAATQEEVGRSRRALLMHQISQSKSCGFYVWTIVFFSLVVLGISVSQFVLTESYQDVVYLGTKDLDICQLADSTYAITSGTRLGAFSNSYDVVGNGTEYEEAISTVRRVMLKASSRLNMFDQVHVRKAQNRLNSWMDPVGVMSDNTWTDANVLVRIPHSLNDYSGMMLPPANMTLFTEQNMSFVDTLRLLNQYTNEVADISVLKSLTNTNSAWFNNKPLMFIFTNEKLISVFFQNVCYSTMDRYQANASRALAQFFCILAVLVVIRLLSFLPGIVSWIALGRNRTKLFWLLSSQIPNGTKATIFRDIDDRLKVASKLHRVDVEQAPRFAYIGTKRRIPAERIGLGLLLAATVMVELFFLISCIVFFMLWFNLEYQLSLVLRPTAGLKRYTARIGFTMGEYFFNANPTLLTVDFDGGVYPQPIDLRLKSHLDVLKQTIGLIITARTSLMYHDHVSAGDIWKGFRMYDGASASTIKMLIDSGSCPSGSNVSLLATPLSTTLAGNASVISTDCIESLTSMFTRLEHEIPQLVSTYKDAYNDHSNLVNTVLKSKYYQHWLNIHKILFSFDYIMDLYASDVSAMETTLRQIFTLIFVCTVLCQVGISIPSIFISLKLQSRDHATRKLLQLVPIKIIEESEELKAYVQQHKLPELGFRNHARQSKKRALKDARTRSILQACADGIFLLDEQGNIEEMNSSACNILATTVVQCLGTKFTERFVSSDEDKRQLKQLLALSGSSSKALMKTDNATSQGTVVEREMMLVASDGTQVPARLSCSNGVQDGKFITTIFVRNITLERAQKDLIQQEKQHSDALLLNVLPQKIAVRLKTGAKNIAELYPDCTVLFSDMVQFTKMSHSLSPVQLIEILNAVVTAFDDAAADWGIEKIKTIGDAYFAIAGLGDQATSLRVTDGTQKKFEHPEQMCRFALGMMRALDDYNTSRRPDFIQPIQIRVGIHTGPVTGGVIGKTKYMFDCFGDTVNTASRMESTSLDGKIQVSKQTHERVAGNLFKWTERPGVYCKGLGEITTYVLEGDVQSFALMSMRNMSSLLRPLTGSSHHVPSVSLSAVDLNQSFVNAPMLGVPK